MNLHDSAFKHGESRVDVEYVASNYLIAYAVGDDPTRELRLGYTHSGRMLEVIVLVFPSGNELAIHAMRIRKTYLDLLP